MRTCRYKVEAVVIRWYAPNHPTRPGEIDLLPWCMRFGETRVFQQGGPGGFYAYRSDRMTAVEPEDPTHWLRAVFLDLAIRKGVKATAIVAALEEFDFYAHVYPREEGYVWGDEPTAEGGDA